ncbi:eL32 family ribosomal protein [Patescibacteria group bacterium]|nr:eL32 family ribosomal protein [Patescibacteria group bacterium]
MTKKFLRRQGNLLSKLGKGRKKKQKWRRPTGRDNKMREKRKGYPAVVSIGHKKSKKESRKIKEKILTIVQNTKDLEKLKQNEIIIIGKIGKKKREEIIKKAEERKIKVYNLPKKIKGKTREGEKTESKDKDVKGKKK